METWLVFFSTSAHTANNQTGSFESILLGLSHQKNYLKASILFPHRTKALPKMLYAVNLSNWTWFKSSNDTFPKSLALDDQMIWTGQPLHPDTVITAVKAHQNPLLITDGKVRVGTNGYGYFLSGYVTNWRWRVPGSQFKSLNCASHSKVKRGSPIQAEWMRTVFHWCFGLVLGRSWNLNHQVGSSPPPLGYNELWKTQKKASCLISFLYIHYTLLKAQTKAN